MRTTEIESKLRQRPFVPFRLCMTDGTSYEARHPEMILASRTIIALAIHKLRARQPEGVVFCDPVHIIRTEPRTNSRSMPRRPSKR